MTLLTKTQIHYDWVRRNPELKQYHRAKSRAKSRGLDFTLSFEDFKSIYSKQVCEICTTELVWGMGHAKLANLRSLDRVNSKLGYTKENCVCICYRCNRMKNESTVEELERLLSWLKSKQANG